MLKSNKVLAFPVLTFLLVLASMRAWSQDKVVFHPVSVKIVMAKEGEKLAKGGILRARLGEKILMYAVVEGTMGARHVVVSSAPSILQKGRVLPSEKIVRQESIHGLELKWYKVQAIGESYNNTAGGFHWDKIDYEEFPISHWGTNWHVLADAHPLPPYSDENKGAGTMAFMLRVRQAGKILSSPGKGSIFRGGLSDSVPRVAFRKDDSYIGRLTELFNTPYIWGSSGTSPKDHQSERLIGSDCADFIVYGARRLGKHIPYRATWHLPLVTKTIARSKSVDEKGRFLDRAKHPLKIGEKAIHIGDLLLFKGHVGALVRDMTPKGILDGNDVMIHTLWAPPKMQPIGETPYSSSNVKILRWK